MGYDQLGGAARAFGLPPPGASLRFQLDGLAIAATLIIESGNVRGFTLEVTGPLPLPEIAFTRETPGDRRGKRLGISRELQTGDPAFDDAVYVDTDEPDSRIVPALASATVRGAVLELLARHERLETGLGGLRFASTGGADHELEPDGFRRLVATAHALVVGMTAARRAELDVPGYRGAHLQLDPPPFRPFLTTRLQRVLSMAVVISLVGSVVVLDGYCVQFCWRPIAASSLVGAGVLTGAVAAILCVLPLAVAIRGRSSSYRRWVFLAWMFLLLGAAIGPAALAAVNAVGDGSPVVEHIVPIAAIDRRSDDDGDTTTVHVRATWRASDDDIVFDLDGTHPELRQDSPWRVATRSGALGWEWIVP